MGHGPNCGCEECKVTNCGRSRNMPGYWMNETTGVLRPAVQAYLNESDMTPSQIGVMRAYLRQWMQAEWRGPVEELRDSINKIVDRTSLTSWLRDAVAWGIDPL